MNIGTDSFFNIGSTHTVCEDYALDGLILDRNKELMFHYAIVCDGCSSSIVTDVGARILAYTMAEHLKLPYLESVHRKNIHSLKDIDPDIMHKNLFTQVIQDSYVTSQRMGINSHCLDCTLVMALSDGKDHLVFMEGDGAIIVKNNSGDIKVHEISYTTNAPWYLSYRLDNEAAMGYHSYFEGSKETKTTLRAKGKDSPTVMLESIRGEVTKPTYYHYTEKDDISSITVTSDGIDTFQNKEDSQFIDCTSMAYRFTNYKNSKGEFLKRRMNRLVNKECAKEGLEHLDDVSSAAIWIKP